MPSLSACTDIHWDTAEPLYSHLFTGLSEDMRDGSDFEAGELFGFKQILTAGSLTKHSSKTDKSNTLKLVHLYM